MSATPGKAPGSDHKTILHPHIIRVNREVNHAMQTKSTGPVPFLLEGIDARHASKRRAQLLRLSAMARSWGRLLDTPIQRRAK